MNMSLTFLPVEAIRTSYGAFLSRDASRARAFAAETFPNLAAVLARDDTNGHLSTNLLARIVEHACAWPQLFPAPLLPLSAESNPRMELTVPQSACIVSHAFLCTMPETRCNAYPILQRTYESETAKLRCLLNYLDVCLPGSPLYESLAPQKIVFERKSMSGVRLSSLEPQNEMAWPHVNVHALIGMEKVARDINSHQHGPRASMVDFANRRIGGGALSGGCVQEEILFMECPDLISSMFLAPEPMLSHEAIIMSGARPVNRYQGYGRSFQYLGCVATEQLIQPCDDRVIAIDAVPFRGAINQFEFVQIEREILKAVVGFSGAPGAIVTGRWGCGAFGGNDQLKFLIQWMAAALVGVSTLEYCAFDAGHAECVNDFLQKFATVVDGLSARIVYSRLLALFQDAKFSALHASGAVFDFVLQHFSSSSFSSFSLK
jgi:poly(ADP-ribose) glycohydrolase